MPLKTEHLLAEDYANLKPVSSPLLAMLVYSLLADSLARFVPQHFQDLKKKKIC